MKTKSLNVKVENMIGPKGNAAENQFIIQTDEGLYFQSYRTVIAVKGIDGKTYLDKNSWDYSKTTGKYRNIFLRESKAETEKKIKDGTYKLIDLNH